MDQILGALGLGLSNPQRDEAAMNDIRGQAWRAADT
jgi:hypothetical protein